MGRPSAILEFHIFAIFVKKIKRAPISTSTCKIWCRSDDPRPSHCVFSILQYGGRPPSWVWYAVISDHSRLVFDGPNILLKLHVDRIYTLRDIAIFIFGRFDLTPNFLRVLGDITPNEFRYCRNPKRTVFERKHVVNH